MDNLCLSISKKWIQIRAGQLVFEVTVKNGYDIDKCTHFHYFSSIDFMLSLIV